ncbi:unnamed protein product, partial [Phyllotreta striolata]
LNCSQILFNETNESEIIETMFTRSAIILALALSALPSSHQTNCIVTEFSQVESAVRGCDHVVIRNLQVPGGRPLKLDLRDGATLTFEGRTVFGIAHWLGHLVQVTGKRVTVEGAQGSVLDAQGEKYWDGHGGSGGVTKPRFFHVGTSGGSVFKNIYLRNCAHFCVGVTATDTHLFGWTINVTEGNTRGAKNTDGFGVSHSENILIENSVVMNQDDCVVVNSGRNYLFRNMKCVGSHGLSFSLGASGDDHANGVTQNVTFKDSVVEDGSWGIHVKTKRGTGLLTDVVYENIKFSGLVRDGIYINQDYGDTGNVSRPFKISNLRISKVYGSMVHNKKAIPVHIVCNKNGCSNFNWSDINVKGVAKNSCNYHPNGFTC